LNARRLLLLLLFSVAACAPTAAANTAVPTLTLIPVTATLTPTIAPPTATPGDLSAPEDVIPATVPPASGAAQALRDPVAVVLVEKAQQMIAGDLDLPTSRVRLLDVVPTTWTDSTLNCPPLNSTPVPQQTLGYRILLQVGDQTYIMHADFDRVVPCAAENEQLPPGFPTEEPTVESTAEVTAEATAEPAA